jgi:hypothetical protein
MARWRSIMGQAGVGTVARGGKLLQKLDRLLLKFRSDSKALGGSGWVAKPFHLPARGAEWANLVVEGSSCAGGRAIGSGGWKQKRLRNLSVLGYPPLLSRASALVRLVSLEFSVRPTVLPVQVSPPQALRTGEASPALSQPHRPRPLGNLYLERYGSLREGGIAHVRTRPSAEVWGTSPRRR